MADWLLETHAHADHLLDAPYLQLKLGGTLVIGREIVTVQCVFGQVFNEPGSFAREQNVNWRCGGSFALAVSPFIRRLPSRGPIYLLDPTWN